MVKVSVIIPTYNRREMVTRAIDSVTAQTQTDLEVIVVDDGSTDDTAEVVRGMSDKRIRYVFRSNGGPAGARNLGLARAKGQYVAFLDSDDFWPPRYLEMMLLHLDAQPAFGGAYSAITLVRPDGQQVKSYHRPAGKSGRLAEDLFQRGFIWPSATLFRASAWARFFFDERLSRSSEDSDAFLRLSVHTQLLFVPDIEAFHVMSKDSLSETEGVNCSRAISLERFYFDLGGREVVRPCTARRRLSHAYRAVAEDRRAKGAKTAALALYRRAIHYWPCDPRLYLGWLQAKMLRSRDDPEPSWKMPDRLGEPIGPSRFE
ncbi:MAG: glycosyltransferase family 2 protein [Sedimentisphaerales bacterium]|nr:glycosyltransferase family 2 protein [Sedimentisphaerales bacterium]